MSIEQTAVRYASFETLKASGGDDALLWLLGANELAELERLTAKPRQQTWKWGRILSRQLLRDYGVIRETSSEQMEILSINAFGQNDRPAVYIDGVLQAVSLSISHSDRGILVALSAATRVGVDLVDLEQESFGSLWVWMTTSERAWMDRKDSEQQARVWAVKEAVYKALNEGESFSPLRIAVVPGIHGRYSCFYKDRDMSSICRVHISEIDNHLAAVVEYGIPLDNGDREKRQKLGVNPADCTAN